MIPLQVTNLQSSHASKSSDLNIKFIIDNVQKESARPTEGTTQVQHTTYSLTKSVDKDEAGTDVKRQGHKIHLPHPVSLRQRQHLGSSSRLTTLKKPQDQ